MTGNIIEGEEEALLLGGSGGESVQRARREMWAKRERESCSARAMMSVKGLPEDGGALALLHGRPEVERWKGRRHGS